MPPVLAHTVYQVVEFDQQLRSRGYRPRVWPTVRREGDELELEDEDDEWEGLSETILGRQEWFDRWLEGERECASPLTRPIARNRPLTAACWQSLTSAISTQSARATRGTSCRKTTTTRARMAARRGRRSRRCGSRSSQSSSPVRTRRSSPGAFAEWAADVTGIRWRTERYRPLPLRHTLPFLLSLHLPLLQSYAGRITSSLDAFESLSFGILPGALGQTTAATAGVGGLVRLVRAGVSARWMSERCEEWGEDAVSLVRLSLLRDQLD